MGLSSSQGRLLMLTSRLSDIEYQEIMVSQRKNQLAAKTEAVAKEYNEAISNTKLQLKVTDSESDKGFSWEDMTYKNLQSMGYLIADLNNALYLEKDSDGNWIIPKDMNGNAMLELTENGNAKINDDIYTIKDAATLSSNKNTLQNALKNGVLYPVKSTLTEINELEANNKERTETLEKEVDSVEDSEEIEKQIAIAENQYKEMANQLAKKDGITFSDVGTDTQMQEIMDTSDDAAAESKYNYETAKLSRQDNRLDLELNQLETQHEAVLKELESVKEVISNNVDRTFKLFSDS